MSPGKHAAPVQPDDGPAAGSEVAAHVAADISIVGGNPSAEEVAAVTAVLTAVLEEISDELGRQQSTAPSAWARSQRSVRTPLHPASGAWRGFSG